MEKRLYKWLTFLACLVLTFGNSLATSLGPGDIAFTSFNSDGNKRFSFVLLRDISDTTSIYFTDNGWSTDSNTWYNTTEGTILWTYSGSLARGSEVIIDPTLGTTSAGVYSMPDLGFNVSTNGDAILAYTG